MANETIFAVASFDKIQSYVDSGVLRYPAYVLCKDNVHKNNLVFIDKDLKIQPIKGYKQDAIKQVEELPSAENAESNVFYFCNGVGYLFVNNIPPKASSFVLKTDHPKFHFIPQGSWERIWHKKGEEPCEH